ncbi:MAG: hypothetical protein BA863_05120 [Desulfovibrio sp. S3730MH75]|nr:MAG: hypothetical protein BA863_05120 [Desulfovibrio sp. S3730MH75]
MAKNKAPAFQFYVRDWLSEPEGRRLRLASRGIWIDILSHMWLEEEQGKLAVEGTELGRMCGASEAEINRFLQEAQRVDLCDVSLFCPTDVPNCPQNVQLVSRRMHREWKAKHTEKLRKRKQRSRKGVPSGGGEMSHPSSSSASASANNTNINTNKLINNISSENGSEEREFEDSFERSENPNPNGQYSSGPKKTDCPSKSNPSRQGFMACWNVYPVQQGEEDAWQEWCRLERNGTLEASFAIQDKIILMNQEDDRWKEGFTPKFAKWLKGKGWNDEPYRKPENGSGIDTQADFLVQAKALREKNQRGDKNDRQ